MRNTILLVCSYCFLNLATMSSAISSEYVVVVSKATHDQREWAQVVETLVEKHDASVFEFQNSVHEVLPNLKQQLPRYTCFVARHEEVDRDLVRKIYELTMNLDEDPYTDTFWGILTGFDAANALKIAKHNDPLEIKKVVSGTEFATEMVIEGFWYDELVKNKHVKKLRGERAKPIEGPRRYNQSSGGCDKRIQAWPGNYVRTRNGTKLANRVSLSKRILSFKGRADGWAGFFQKAIRN